MWAEPGCCGKIWDSLRSSLPPRSLVTVSCEDGRCQHWPYLVASGELEAWDRRLPGPRVNEVRATLRSTTLSGSYVHYLQHGRNGSFEVRTPCVSDTRLQARSLR